MVVVKTIKTAGYRMRHKGLLPSIIPIFIISIALNNISYAQDNYKEGMAYLIQKIESTPKYQFYILFKHHYYLPYFYGYYVVNENTLNEFFTNDTVDYERAIMLCDPVSTMFSDSIVMQKVISSTRIEDILKLDDSEIYEIGGGKYIIRKIQYAYMDNSQVKVYIKGYNYFMWDDLQTDDTATMNAFYATYEVGKLYGRNYYQCYHHLIAILPTPLDIQQHIWRRLYQLKHID